MIAPGEDKGVNVLDPKELLHFAQDTSGEGRARLARAVSQFFEERELTAQQQRLAGEILLNLVRQAETDLRRALAERLSVQDNVPVDLIIFLANDEITVAESVLRHSPVLKDIDLLYIIQSKERAHWEVIAQREAVSPVVAERLIETRDPGTVLKLIDNQRVHLQKGALKKIIRVAAVSEELQAPLLRRPEIDAETATDLYMVVSQALRQQIAERFPLNPLAVDRAFDLLLQEFVNEARGSSHVLPEMKALARKFNTRGDITPDLLIRTLRRGQMAFFIALFAEKMEFTPDVVLRMIQRDGGKSFILACRAMGMMKSEFASLFLLSRGIRTGDKIVDQRELAMALKYFDTLKDFDVGRIVKSWARSPELV